MRACAVVRANVPPNPLGRPEVPVLGVKSREARHLTLCPPQAMLAYGGAIE